MSTNQTPEIIVDARTWGQRLVDSIDEFSLVEQLVVSVVGAIVTAIVLRRWG